MIIEISIILFSTLTLFIYFFLLGTLKKDNSYIDIAWGLGFILIAFMLLVNHSHWRLWVIALLVTVWGTRLSAYIFIRKTNEEDSRYARFKENWNHQGIAYKSFIRIYLLQMILMIIIAAPFFIAAYSPSASFQWSDIIALELWTIGFVFEAISDHQLYLFKKTPENKGKLMKEGLWKFSRHPNYFGEVLIWWSLFLLVYPVNYGFYAIVSPILLTYLILYVSGVPLLEENGKKYPGWKAYVNNTSKFFPWFPRNVMAKK